MTSFLFWNVMGRDLRDIIARAAVEHEVDILMLAECGVSDAEMVATLRSEISSDYVALSKEKDKIRLFTRTPKSKWKVRATASVRITIWRVRLGQSQGIILVVGHLLSKTYASSDEQALLAAEIAKEIARIEDEVGHQRTLFVGDLNMNPFEDGIVAALSLNGVMTKAIAERGERTVQGNSYRYFYNPMWGLFGDRTPGPPGTYYHRSPTGTDVYWHIFDQVLLRSSLMGQLHELQILDSIDGVSLLTQPVGLPNLTYSDHLPLFFSVNLD